MSEPIKHYERAGGVTAEPSGDRTIVLDADGDRMSTLSVVGTLVWQWLPSDIDSLVDRLQQTFPEVERATLQTDVEDFLEELIDACLVVEVDAAR